MKRKKIPFNIVIAAMTAVMFSSCKKFLQIDPPETQAELSRIFTDDQTAISATVGLYTQFTTSGLNFCNSGLTLYPAQSADEVYNVSQSANDETFRSNSLLSSSSIVRAMFWTNPYKNIYQANAVLEGLSSSLTLTPAIKSQLLGEMLYIRALHYFYLVNLYGDVPLLKSTDFEINSLMPRTSVQAVYKQIIEDLLMSRDLLTPTFVSSVSTRPNKGAVCGLLARVYLYQQNWEAAESIASEVISSGKFTLETLPTVFIGTSKESLFSITKTTGNSVDGTLFIPSSGTVRPTYALTDQLFAAFSSIDNRKVNWLKSNTVAGTTYFYPNKYKVRASTPITESLIVQRLAEIYLIRAEARANLNKLSEGIDDLDMIRSRAGLPKIKITNPTIGKEDLLTAIGKERQLELFCEWGHRWFDLKRLGKVDAVLAPIKGVTWNRGDAFYPIPQTEIQRNPNLIQNDGYAN
ncbi:RagB/SusD family nutrient uptake outer membrane protein [Pedobacter borealis]|uniref:RagB/SusD family nutrient uptake outer membrane protein n=1 Tax=Pedobacter borealis TaxID=475254 RepID=UPI000B1D5580|nr:RagB/SusD family nutrient uptake outer membrane protein [Pedobacter borealis]